ncbi:unnamed protein product [Mortierella alpina]
MVKAITFTQEFDELINSGKKVIVDYHAVWCGPCKVIAPKYEMLSTKPENSDIEFVKVDVDELTDVSSKAGVRAMPTFQIYHKGIKVNELLGADWTKLQALVEEVKAL